VKGRHFDISASVVLARVEMRSIKMEEMEGEPGSEEMCFGGTKSCRREREGGRERERHFSLIGQKSRNSRDARRSMFFRFHRSPP